MYIRHRTTSPNISCLQWTIIVNFLRNDIRIVGKDKVKYRKRQREKEKKKKVDSCYAIIRPWNFKWTTICEYKWIYWLHTYFADFFFVFSHKYFVFDSSDVFLWLSSVSMQWLNLEPMFTWIGRLFDISRLMWERERSFWSVFVFLFCWSSFGKLFFFVRILFQYM